MSIITLTTDLGTKDHKVASIKGSILSLEKNVPIVDITHHIEPHDIIQTAYIVRNSYSHFPKGSIHMIAVDCFYHKDRKFLVLEANGHYFIMPDNGLFSLIFPEIKPEKIYEISHNASDDVARGMKEAAEQVGKKASKEFRQEASEQLAKHSDDVASTSKGISKEEYNSLRKKTPSQEIRDHVNNIDGEKFDPIYGYPVETLEADHIVSMK